MEFLEKGFARITKFHRLSGITSRKSAGYDIATQIAHYGAGQRAQHLINGLYEAQGSSLLLLTRLSLTVFESLAGSKSASVHQPVRPRYDDKYRSIYRFVEAKKIDDQARVQPTGVTQGTRAIADRPWGTPWASPPYVLCLLGSWLFWHWLACTVFWLLDQTTFNASGRLQNAIWTKVMRTRSSS